MNDCHPCIRSILSPIYPAGHRRAGWGVESRYGSMQVRGAGRAIRLASKQRATPHPALRATFPSKLEKGCAPAT
jgi:hypothetical protein